MKILFSSKYGKHMNDRDDSDTQEALKYIECKSIDYLKQNWKEMYAALFLSPARILRRGLGKGRIGRQRCNFWIYVYLPGKQSCFEKGRMRTALAALSGGIKITVEVRAGNNAHQSLPCQTFLSSRAAMFILSLSAMLLTGILCE